MQAETHQFQTGWGQPILLHVHLRVVRKAFPARRRKLPRCGRASLAMTVVLDSRQHVSGADQRTAAAGDAAGASELAHRAPGEEGAHNVDAVIRPDHSLPIGLAQAQEADAAVRAAAGGLPGSRDVGGMLAGAAAASPRLGCWDRLEVDVALPRMSRGQQRAVAGLRQRPT